MPPVADRFADVYARQLEFNRRVFADRGLDLAELSAADRIRWTKEFVLHVEGELHELLRETPWKMHRVSVDPVTRGNVLEEWVDAFKYLLGLAQVWGFTPAELLEEFGRKSEVVEYRYGMEQRLRAISPTSTRVVGVDIDGVLNDYPRSFLAWANHGTSGPDTLREMRTTLSPRGYADLKDAYRRSGAKRTQGVRPGAKELLDGVRAAGGIAVLLSKRPYWRFSRIYADTLAWLEGVGLRHDAVLFHPDKHRVVLEKFPGLAALVEDDPDVARQVLAVGKPVVLVDGELNRDVDVPGAVRVAGPEEALVEVERLLGAREVRS
jgi:hypothetical protein